MQPDSRRKPSSRMRGWGPGAVFVPVYLIVLGGIVWMLVTK